MGKFNKKNLHLVQQYTEDGLTAKEIAEKLNETVGNIEYYRRKYKWNSKFTSILDRRKNEIIKLVKEDKTDREISKIINCCEESIRKFRLKNNITRPNKRFSKDIDITKRELEIIIGTVLGDGHIGSRNQHSSLLTLTHSIKQEEFFLWKVKNLPSLNICSHYNMKHKHPNVSGYSKSTPSLNFLKNSFYPNGTKVIPFDLLDDFTELSLAVLFMDDGYGCKSSGKVRGVSLCLCSFQEDELNKFCNFLLQKFNLHFRLYKKYNKHYNKYYSELTLKRSDFQQFKNIVKPFLLPSMLYKIGS